MDHDNLVEILKAIRAYIDTRENAFELANIHRDLASLHARLLSGEYQRTDFLARQQFDTPRRMREFLHYLHGLQSHAAFWAELLGHLDLAVCRDVLDLLPGSLPKVEFALLQLGYQQRVTVLDVDATILTTLSECVRLFSPAFTLATQEGDFWQAAEQRYDVVCANHILDDLLLHQYCQQQNAALSDLYADESQFRTACVALLQQKIERSWFTELAHQLSRRVASSRWLVMVDYPGVTEIALGLSAWRDYVNHSFQLLYEECLRCGFRVELTNLTTAKDEEKRFFILRRD